MKLDIVPFAEAICQKKLGVNHAIVQQHGEVLEALRRRDGEAAAQRMRSHWLSAMEGSIRDVTDLTQSTLPEQSIKI